VTIFYVATNGSDSGTGSATSPWRTISKAMKANLQPGDEVVVRSGTYKESVVISKDGSAADYITLRSEVPGGAKIEVPSGKAHAIQINANYVEVDGFEVSGASRSGISGNHVHHVKVTNNVAHDNATAGIYFGHSEFLSVEGNVTYKNASSGVTSGISIHYAQNVSGDTKTEGFRIVVRNNISYDNVTKGDGAHTDGNGIIIDDFLAAKSSTLPAYTYPTLVEGNVVYQNGGAGIQVFHSDYVTVRNNTAWHNNVDLQSDSAWRGELQNTASSHNAWVNNIAVADPKIHSDNTALANLSYRGAVNKDVVWHNNLTFNGTPGQASIMTNNGNAVPSAANGNKLGVDPKFVQAPFDFHLRPGSPAIDGGTNRHGLAPIDRDGDARVVGTVDIGAYETGGGTGGSGNEKPHSVALTGKTIAETASAGTVVGQLSAVDPDGDTITFSVSGDSRFTVNGGAHIVVAQGASLAVDGEQTVPLTITADDGKGGVTSASISIVILDTSTGATIVGDSLANQLSGGAGDDKVYGRAGGDKLYGGAGKDYLDGGSGNDQLQGGLGKDVLLGGTGADTFVFASLSHAGKGSGRDVVSDFSRSGGDKIDLRDVDANAKLSGDQAFSFIGTKAFSGKAGELKYQDGIVAGDVNGDRAADFQIEIANDHALSSGDFLL
jgi:serralysin